MLAIAFAAMLVVPLAYRVWITFNPPLPRERLSLAEFFGKAAVNRSVRLLKTPLDRWTKTDRAAEPKIAAWLAAHSRIVLPWEWSSEAQKKDPKGYRKAWEKILDETISELDRSVKSTRKELKKCEREAGINRTLHSHLTNQTAKVEGVLATHPPPVTVVIERLSKGRFWGWNRRLEQVRLESETNRVELVSGIAAEAEALQMKYGRISRMVERLEADLKILEDYRAFFSRADEELSGVGEMDLGTFEEALFSNIVRYIRDSAGVGNL